MDGEEQPPPRCPRWCVPLESGDPFFLGAGVVVALVLGGFVCVAALRLLRVL